MRNAIIKRMVFVVVFALAVSGIITGISSYRMLQMETKDKMKSILAILESSLDRQSDLPKQLEEYKTALGDKYRITLIGEDGKVLADSDSEKIEEMENHAQRKEVQEAKTMEIGYESRVSDTFGKAMLYAAQYSEENHDIIRLAIETSAAEHVLLTQIPVFFISFVIAFLLTLILSKQFADSVTRPIVEIIKELSDFDSGKSVLHFKTCAYPEVNIIAETTAQLSENVRSYLEKLEKEKHVRQEFFSNASHELKTPLTAIRGYTELLMGGMAKEELRNEFLGRIHKEVEGMTGLVNDILMISRLETKETVPSMESVSVSLLAEDTVKSFHPAAEEAEVTIFMECDPIEFYMNRKHLEEILSNLISNAIKYNRPNGTIKIMIRKDLDQSLHICVEDTGIGISEDDKGRIFERFYRVDKGRSKRIGGTGLGLSIVKHIAEFYGGFVTVTSTLGEGSSFTVRLPKVVSESDSQ